MEIPGVAAPAGQQPGSAAAAGAETGGLFSLFFEAAVSGEPTQSELALPEAGLPGFDAPVPSRDGAASLRPLEPEADEGPTGEAGVEEALQLLAAEGVQGALVLSFFASAPEAPPPPPSPARTGEPVRPAPLGAVELVAEPQSGAGRGPAFPDPGVASVQEGTSSLERARAVPEKSESVAASAVAGMPAPKAQAVSPPEPERAGSTPAGEAAARAALPGRAERPGQQPQDEASPEEKSRERNAQAVLPGLKDRASTERLWGFWLRRGRGPAEDRAPAPQGRPFQAGQPTPEALPLTGTAAREEVAEAPFSLRPPLWGLDPDRKPGAPLVQSAAPAQGTPTEAPSAGAAAPAGGTSPAAEPAAAAAATSPAAAPAAAAPSEVPPAVRPHPYGPESPAPVHQVVRGLRLSLSREGDKVTVQLEPASLGKVQLVLARNDDGVAAHFRVETPQAHQALLSEAPVLRQALEARGIPLVEVFVALDDRARDGGEGKNGRKSSGRRPTQGELEPAQGATPPPGGATAWGIDTRV